MYAKTIDYYSKRKDKLLEKVDKEINVAKNILAKKYNDLELEKLTKAMRAEFEKLIPQIPYIGGQMNSFTSMLVDCVSLLAMIRVLERKGYKFLQIGEFLYQFHELVNMKLKNKLQESTMSRDKLLELREAELLRAKKVDDAQRDIVSEQLQGFCLAVVRREPSSAHGNPRYHERHEKC